MLRTAHDIIIPVALHLEVDMGVECKLCVCVCACLHLCVCVCVCACLRLCACVCVDSLDVQICDGIAQSSKSCITLHILAHFQHCL